MAFTAREVIMTFRGQNYLSGAIRRIGADVGGLSRTSQLANQRAMLQARASQLQYARSTAQAELMSVSTGSRALGIQRAKAQLGISERRNVEQIRKIEEQRQGNLIEQMRAQQRINALSAVGTKGGVLSPRTRADAERLQRQLEAASAGTGTFGRSAGRRSIAESLRIEAATMEKLREQAASLNLAFERQSQVIANSSIAAQQLAARETELVQREAQLRQAILSRTRAIDENTLAQFRNNFEATKIAPMQAWTQRAASIEHAGRALQMFGLIGVAAMGAAANSAARFSQQFTLAATQARQPGQGANATVRIAQDIQRQVLSLMRQFPASAQDMADSFYQIFSGTNIQNVKTATSAVRVFNQMAVAGGTDLKTMTDAGITLYNNFGGLHGEFKTLTDAGNAFFAAVRYGRMNAEQFANSLPNVVAIAKQAGLSFNDIAGAMAALTRQTGGRFTSRDATGIARMIEVFARPDFIAGAQKFGIAIKDAKGNMRPLLDIIGEFAAKTKGRDRLDLLSLFKEISSAGSTTGRGGTLGTIQARRAFAFLINDIDKYRNVSHLVRADNNELSKSFEAMSKTPGVQWQVFVNRLRVLVYEIGTNAIPAFMELGRPVANAVKWFNDLDDGTKRLIARITTFAAAGTLLLGVFSSIGGGVARLITQFMLLNRVRSLERLIAESRAASAIATPVPPLAATPGIIDPRTGAAFSRSGQVAERAAQRIPSPTAIIDPKTGQAFRQAAQDAESSEAGFIRAGTALKVFGTIGLLVALPFLIQYHSQILKVITGNTLLGNSIALVGAALVALKLGLFTRLAGAGAFAGPLIAGAAVLVGLVAVFTNFAHSADLVRTVLDNLFSSFAGYIITIGLLVAAVYKLRDALIAMKIAQEGASVVGAISAIGPAIIGRIRAITTAVTAARAAEGGLAATGVATAGLEAGTVGLGAAVAGFVPALAIGGALLGGLYLWKRHLDSVHEAQQRVADTQKFLRSSLSGTDLLNAFGDAGTKLESLERAQINYNRAFKELQAAERRGVSGDALQELKLNLYDAEQATNAAKRGLSEFYAAGNKLNTLTNASKRVKMLRDDLSSLTYVAKNYPHLFEQGGRSFDASRGGFVDDPRLEQIKKTFNIKTIQDVQREINLYTKALDTALNTIGATRDRFRSQVTNYINSLIQLKQIPEQARGVMANLNAWIRTLDHVPRVHEIQQYLKVALRLQNANDVPVQFFKEIRRIERMIAQGRASRLTRKQIDFLIKYVFKVDPQSDDAGKLRAQILTYISASVASATRNIPTFAQILPQSPAGQLDKDIRRDVPTTNRLQALQRYWQERRNALAQAAKGNTTDKITPKPAQTRSVQQWINAVIKAQRAMTAHPYDVSKAQAYERIIAQLNARFKDQPALLAAINDVVQTYTSNLDKASNAADKASKKQKVTFEQVLSGVQNMYQQFLSQEQGLMGQLFEGPFIKSLDKFDWGGRVTAFDETKDLKSQIGQFRDFHGLLDQLRKRGAPAELIKQLTALGPAAIDQIRAMTRMSDPEIKKYFGLFKTAQRLIHQQTMADMQQQLAQYRTYGRNAALQIIAGFRDENMPLTRTLTNIIKKAFGSIPTEAQIAASEAAKTAAGTKGTPNAAGVAAGGGGAPATTKTPTTPKIPTTPFTMAPWTDPGRGRFDYRRIQHITQEQFNQTAQVAGQWVGNAKRIGNIVKQFNDPDLTRNQYRLVYRHLENEIRRELKAQGLPNLTNAQLERFIRNLFGYMPARAARTARTAQDRQTGDRRGASATVPDTRQFQPNLTMLKRILNEFGTLGANVKNQYRTIYNDLAKEIIREFRAQHLKRPTDKTIERLIQERLGLKPPPGGWHNAQPRTTQSARSGDQYHTHINITAPKSEHASIKAQARHAAFALTTRHRTWR